MFTHHHQVQIGRDTSQVTPYYTSYLSISLVALQNGYIYYDLLKEGSGRKKSKPYGHNLFLILFTSPMALTHGDIFVRAYNL